MNHHPYIHIHTHTHIYIYTYIVQYSSGVDLVTSRDGRTEDNEDKEELGAECGSFYSTKKNSSRERKTKSTSTGATNCDEDDYGISRRRDGAERGGEGRKEEGGRGEKGGETLRQFGGDPTCQPSVERKNASTRLEVGGRPTRVVSIYTKLFNHWFVSVYIYVAPIAFLTANLSCYVLSLSLSRLDAREREKVAVSFSLALYIRVCGKRDGNSFIPVENRMDRAMERQRSARSARRTAVDRHNSRCCIIVPRLPLRNRDIGSTAMRN